MITPATFVTALAAAKPGDTLKLSGLFADLRPKGHLLTGITLDGKDATFGVLYPAGPVDGLTLIGGTYLGVRIDGANDIDIQSVRFKGVADPRSFGLVINKGSNIDVTNCPFANYKTGAVFSKVDGFTVKNSGFARMFSDGITVGESRNGLICDNEFHGSQISGNEHPDAVQLFSRAASAPVADIIITRNNITGGETQGICGFNHTRLYKIGTVLADGTVLTEATLLNDGGFDKIFITENVLSCGYGQAIALYEARDSHVTNNYVKTYVGAKDRASINLIRCARTVRKGNVVEAGAGKPSVIDPPTVS